MNAVPEQIPFDLPVRPAQGREDFFVTSANRAAVGLIDQWPAWSAPALVLSGPAACGKTHLAAVWAARAGAACLRPDVLLQEDANKIAAHASSLVLDGLDPWVGDLQAETTLFHLYNMFRESGGARSLLLTMRMNPAQAEFALPDLASRLRAAPLAIIHPPDEDLLKAVLLKLFQDRQIKIGEDCIRYILPRMERSLAAAYDIVRRADRMALAQKRPVSIPLLREVMAAQQAQDRHKEEPL